MERGRELGSAKNSGTFVEDRSGPERTVYAEALMLVFTEFAQSGRGDCLLHIGRGVSGEVLGDLAQELCR